jgi:hypothetical protein
VGPAYLHRVEGDLSNARYWYRQAGRAPATAPLECEWQEIAGALLWMRRRDVEHRLRAARPTAWRRSAW